jgi:hypothetical protein
MLKIGGFIVVVVLIAWAIWALFFRLPKAVVKPQPQAGPAGQLPAIGEGPAGRVVEQPAAQPLLEPERPVLEPEQPAPVAAGGRTQVDVITDSRAEFSTLSGNGFNYYDSRDGRFYSISRAGGEPVLLSDEQFPNVESITWGKSGERAVLEFPDGANIVYNFKTKEKATLPRQAEDFAFTREEDRLAYKYVGDSFDDRFLVVSEPNGQGQEILRPLGDEVNNVQVAWSPNEQVVALFRESVSAAGEEVMFVGLHNENWLTLQTNGIGFEGEWSPEGKQMLYSVYNAASGYRPSLYIAGAEGDNIGLGNRSLKVQTWPDKCAFTSETVIYCAVPQNLPEGSGLYPELAESVADAIYRIDLINNLSTPVAFPETAGTPSFNVQKLMLSPDGGELYFTDRVTGRINRLRLR